MNSLMKTANCVPYPYGDNRHVANAFFSTVNSDMNSLMKTANCVPYPVWGQFSWNRKRLETKVNASFAWFAKVPRPFVSTSPFPTLPTATAIFSLVRFPWQTTFTSYQQATTPSAILPQPPLPSSSAPANEPQPAPPASTSTSPSPSPVPSPTRPPPPARSPARSPHPPPPRQSMTGGSEGEIFTRKLITATVAHILRVHQIEGPEGKHRMSWFRRLNTWDKALRVVEKEVAEVLTTSQRAQLPSHVRPEDEEKLSRLLTALTLHIAKFACERSEFGVQTSEVIKRKQSGMNLLLVVLKRSGAFFRSSPELVLLLRCFILPALVDACYTDDNANFSLVLQTFIVLWHNFKGVLLMELGVLMDNIFLPILENRFSPITRKKDIIDVFLHILKSPEAVVMLYYNYDNSFPSWPLFERIISVICRIPEGDSKEMARLLPGEKLPMATPEMNLKIHALRFVVQILVLQAQWCKVPGLGPRFNADREQMFSGSLSMSTRDSAIDVSQTSN
eukprot:g9225.t1